jgi:hypothetical protein
MWDDDSPNKEGVGVRRRLLFIFSAAALAAGLVSPVAAATPHHSGVKGLPEYMPNAPAVIGNIGFTPAPQFIPGAPTAGATWNGLSDSTVTPPDPNGAIGPNSYVEIINLKVAIYNRTGGAIASANLSTLTGHSQFNLSDPMVLWDPDTQRFYYNVWDVSQATMAWGFSKNNNPTTIPGSWCNFTANFGYTTSEFPDYPKLGQTKNFLLIGVNHYPSLSSQHADRSDVLWIDKPQGSAPITTCPPASSFKTGKFTNLRNQDGTQAFTPVPAIQVDPSSQGFIVTSSDIECPDLCGTGTLITVQVVRPSPTDPTVPQMAVRGHSITVAPYQPPATDAPQKNSSNTLDTLDGRLEHAISAVDPTIAKMVVWTGHSVNSGGNRTEFRWYEILPTPTSSPSLVQSGVVSDPSLYVFNGALSPDRTCTLTQCAHGDAIVIGFTTSSSTTFASNKMVSKIGSAAQSPFVLVHASTVADKDFSCSPCRWGDYGGATPDPAASLLTAAHGEVWLTQMFTNGGSSFAGGGATWNWEALP